MDLDKLKIWKSGLTDQQRLELENQAKAETQYQQEKEKVAKTMRSPGFKIIVNKIVAETEVMKTKLQTCKEKDLHKLQAEIAVRIKFLNTFQPYVD